RRRSRRDSRRGRSRRDARSPRVATTQESACVAIEREIRFRVTDGHPPPGGVAMVQAYLLRGPITARVRIAERQPARMTVKAPFRDGRLEWEWRIPDRAANALLKLPLPRVEKTRRKEGRLEV